jgi:putative chitinase
MKISAISLAFCCTLGTLSQSDGAELSSILNQDALLSIAPDADPDILSALVANRNLLQNVGLDDHLLVSHFLAQILTETGGLRRLDENMWYRAERLVAVFRIPWDVAQTLAERPRPTANYVYGARLGNYGRETDDGWQFRGSGFIQLTGRYNFRMRGIEAGLPLEQQPEIARRPREGLLAALAYWDARNINEPAKTNNIREVRRRINPALEGLPQSRLWYRTVQNVVSRSATESGSIEDAVPPTAEEVGAILRDYGFLGSDPNESGSSDGAIKALKEFQKSQDLPETGRVDKNTFKALTDPQNWRHSNPVPPSGNESASLGRTGVAYDVTTKASRLLDVFAPSAAQNAPSSERGTGFTDSQVQLQAAELGRLNGASPLFPTYEQQLGTRDRAGNFVPFSVFEPDTRTVVPSTIDFPARAIAFIAYAKSTGDQLYACSGSFISANVILTAGHCVHSGGATGSWHRNFTIIPGRNSAVAPYGTCTAKELFSVTGWVSSNSNEEARLNDVGAIKLDCDAGRRTGWFDLELVATDTPMNSVVLYGYPCDKTPSGKQWKSAGPVDLSTQYKLFYKMSTYACMSGGPILSPNNKILAVHTNGLFAAGEPWQSYNAATRLSDDLVISLRNWMTN